MAKANPQEKQAMISVVLASVGGLCVIAAISLVLRRFNLEHFEVRYTAKGLSFPLILACIGLAGLSGTVGFFAGLNSAGHKRNKLSHLSWTGFLGNSAVLTLALSVLVFFWLAKEKVG